MYVCFRYGKHEKEHVEIPGPLFRNLINPPGYPPDKPLEMTKFYALAIILAFKLANLQAPSNSKLLAFSIVTPAKVVNLKAEVRQQKVFLNWGVTENETADRFAIEKSTDGKNFEVAALAFGSDIPGQFQYKYFEKAGKQKISYRIRLVNKDRKEEYSEVITIDPSVNRS